MLRRLIAGLALVLGFAVGVEADVECDYCVSSVLQDGSPAGTCTGTPWDDPYATIIQTWAAGDIVCVADDHDESTGATIRLTGSVAEGINDPVIVVCVDVSTCTAGSCELCGDGERAKITTTGVYDIELADKLWIYGLEFYSGDDISATLKGADGSIWIEKGRLELTGVGGTDNISLGGSTNRGRQVYLVDVDIDFSANGQGIVANASHWIWKGGTLGYNATYLIGNIASIQTNGVIRGVDLSILSNPLINVTGIGSTAFINIERCKLHASFAPLSGSIDVPGVVVRILNSSSYTGGNPESRFEEYHYQGEIVLSTNDHLDDSGTCTPPDCDGATDGTSRYSWEFDTSGGSNVLEIYEPLCSKTPIATWVAGGSSKTLLIYGTGPDNLETKDVWVKYETRTTDSSDSALSKWVQLRADPGDTTTAPGDDTTHDGDWINGGAEHYVFSSGALTFDKDGVVYAWPCIAYDTTSPGNFWFNPKIVQ